MSYLRKNIEAMAGYTPGEQPEPGDRVVKLNTNENPYPPSPRVIEALRSLDPDRLRRYPDPMADKRRATWWPGCSASAARTSSAATGATNS